MSSNGNPDVEVLDLCFQDRHEAIASFLIKGSRDHTLIECGPTACLRTLLSELERRAVSPDDVGQVLLTHIHLDHAGAAGSLARVLPKARIYVSEVGAPHLADPSRLLKSAARVYGPDMERLWGEVLPVPKDRIVPLKDGDVIETSGRSFRAMYTPGHASHHIAYLDASGGNVFTGDVAGVRLPGVQRVLPPTPPPDLDLDRWSDSIQALREAKPEALYLTHFGKVTDVSRHLDELHHRLYSWYDLLLSPAREGLEEVQLVRILEQHANAELEPTIPDPEVRSRFALVAGYGMDVAGFMRYFRQRRLLDAERQGGMAS